MSFSDGGEVAQFNRIKSEYTGIQLSRIFEVSPIGEISLLDYEQKNNPRSSFGGLVIEGSKVLFEYSSSNFSEEQRKLIDSQWLSFPATGPPHSPLGDV